MTMSFNLTSGALIRPTTTVNLRRTPGHRSKPADDVITEVTPEHRLRVLNARTRAADDLNWWQVETVVDGRRLSGWIAEQGVDGAPLLVPADSVDGPTTSAFQPGGLVTARVALRVRRNPGHLTEQQGDVLGIFWPGTTLFVREGPRQVDGLNWWLVSGINASGEAVTGWVAQQLADGTVLVDRPPMLPGTAIPTPEQNRYLGAPYQGRRRISQLFGENPDFYGRYSYEGVSLRGHNAVDIAMPVGVDLMAVDNGFISQVGSEPAGYGNYVVIQHAWGESLYAHLSQATVSRGQQVARGQLIGQSGNTGSSTGPHLHIAIRFNPYWRGDGWGGFSDPLPYLPPDSYTVPSYVQRDGERTLSAQSLAANVPPTPLSPDDPARPRP